MGNTDRKHFNTGAAFPPRAKALGFHAVNRMKEVNERDIDLIISCQHYIKYLNSKPDVKVWEIWDGMRKLEEVGIMLSKRNYTNEQIEPYCDLESAKDLIENFMQHLYKELEKMEK